MQKFRIGGLVAICLCLVGLLLSLGNHEHQNGDQASPPNNKVNYKPNSSTKNEAGLSAQLRTVEATEKQARYAGWSLLFLCAATIAAVLAAWYARRAVTGVHETNEIAKEAFQIDQRPWISIDSIEITNVCSTPIEDHGDNVFQLSVSYKITLINKGKTPACDIRTRIDANPNFRSFNKDVAATDMTKIQSYPIDKFTIGPNTESVREGHDTRNFEQREGHIVIAPGIGIFVTYHAYGEKAAYETIQVASIKKRTATGQVSGIDVSSRNIGEVRDGDKPTFFATRDGISRMT